MIRLMTMPVSICDALMAVLQGREGAGQPAVGLQRRVAQAPGKGLCICMPSCTAQQQRRMRQALLPVTRL